MPVSESLRAFFMTTTLPEFFLGLNSKTQIANKL